MSQPIRMENVSKRFRGVQALSNCTFEVPEGAVYALVGPNGAGKTTAIKILMNIVDPTSGHVEVLGADSRRLSPEQLRQIGYVSENQDLPDWMTVEYLLGYLKPFYPAWDDALAAELVRQFDLPLQRKLGQLSRGVRMKAALTAALAYRPRLIVLDEPFSGLDPLVRDEFIEGLLERAGESAIFISSHDLAEIESFASHVGYLDAGRMEFSEEMTALSDRFREIRVTLGAEPRPRSEWPQNWLGVETSAAVVSFVDSHFHPEKTEAEIAKAFPDARNVSVSAMPLRAIFVAVAKAGRKEL